jgi:hypothetical protein
MVSFPATISENVNASWNGCSVLNDKGAIASPLCAVYQDVLHPNRSDARALQFDQPHLGKAHKVGFDRVFAQRSL